MDTLTFNSPVVLRHLTFSEQRKMPIDVIELPKVLEGLELTMDQARGSLQLVISILPDLTEMPVAVYRLLHSVRL